MSMRTQQSDSNTSLLIVLITPPLSARTLLPAPLIPYRYTRHELVHFNLRTCYSHTWAGVWASNLGAKTKTMPTAVTCEQT